MNKVIQICSGCRHEIKGKIYARFFGLYYCTKCAILIKFAGEDVGEMISEFVGKVIKVDE